MISSHVPHFIEVARHDLALHALDVTDNLVTRLTMDIVSNVLLSERIALNRVAAKEFGRNWMIWR
ncbi:hypothetical protein BGV53_02760 [Burkholderia ubonensis]|nr:hypothetical protein BGV53_02760 [Burkholderia ubonensis]